MKKTNKLETILRQGAQGLTAGFADEIVDPVAAALASAILGQSYGDTLSQARALSKSELEGDYRDNPKTALAANLAGALSTGVAAGPKLASQVGLSALSGVGSAGDTIEDRVKGGALGGAFGLGGAALAGGVNRIAKGASDLITPEVRKTAQKLKSMGIPVRLSQLADSKFLSAVDMALSKVPFSGANASQASQRKAFTKALSNTFGENADTITEDVLGSAKGRLSGEYDRLLGNTDIPIDRRVFAQDLSQLVGDLSLETDDAGAAFLAKQADNILNTIDNNGGKLTGKSYQKLRQTLKGAKGTNFSVGQVQKLVDDTVRNSIPANIGDQLGQIDSQYRNMKIAEKLYGQLQNASGEIKPETLYNAAKPNISNLAYGGGGELGDLARAGRLLRPTIPDSGTATQLAGMSALGGASAAAFIDPTLALASLGTIGTARGLNSAMTSNYLQQGMSPAIQGSAQALVNSGAIPSIARSAQQASQQQPGYNPNQDPALQGMLEGYNPDNDPELQSILGVSYDPSSDPELEAILNRTETNTQTIVPPINAPLLQRISQAESGGNVNARNPNSSASGEYQFTDPTWAGMIKNYPETGLTMADKNRPDAQQIMAELLTQENTNAYKNAGITPNDADLYMAHFLGAPNAVKAKKAMGSGAYAEALFPQAAQSNKNIFYNNGKPRTIEEVYRVLGSKVGV